jgi:hypothetical protein
MGYKGKVAAAAGFVPAVGLAATAFAQGGSGSGTVTPTAAASSTPGARQRPSGACGRAMERPRAQRLVHGTAEVEAKRGGFANVTVDRGTITSTDPSTKTLTIKRADGQSVTATASDSTRICVDGHEGGFGELKTGDRAGIVQADYDGRHVVRRIVDVGPASSGSNTASDNGDLSDAQLGV